MDFISRYFNKIINHVRNILRKFYTDGLLTQPLQKKFEARSKNQKDPYNKKQVKLRKLKLNTLTHQVSVVLHKTD